MATAKRDLTNPPVQGPRSFDAQADIVSADELARRLDIPKTTLYGWRYKNKGPRGHRVGKHLRYRWSDVLEWLDHLD
jgi:excisionase family DNA binding protein